MIAPSPDWFSGFYDYDARNDKGSSWAGEFVLLTYPWGAGTEKGGELEYSLNNDPETPHKPIVQFTNETVPSTGVFLNRGGDQVLPVVKWHCTLVDGTAVPPGPRLRGTPDLDGFP